MSAQPTPLMQQALEKIGEDWSPYPRGVYDRTLQAMLKRGLIEERFHRHDNGATSYQYRRVKS